MKKLRVKKNENEKFVGRFFKLSLIFLVVLSFIFFVLGIKMNENFFKKYSEDKKLEDSTIKKIQILKAVFLGFQTLSLILVFIMIYFNKNAKVFIGKNKNLILNIFLLVGTIIFLLLIAEIALRVVYYDKTTSHDFGPTQRFNYNYVQLNNEGFRDKDYSITKPDGVKRIIGLGDSYTYGWGIKNINDSYLKVLEKRLNENGKYEVMNFGLPGRDTKGELEILKNNALKYNPDLIVIGYLPNDMKNVDKEIKEYEWKEIKLPFHFWLRNYFYLYFFLETQYNKILEKFNYKETYYSYLTKVLNSKVNKEYNKQFFREISEISKEKGMKVLVVVFPMIYNLQNYSYTEADNFVKGAADENDFYFLDLLDTYKKYKESELVLSRFDAHPNEFAHKLAADAIYEKLKEENLISQDL